MKKNGVGKAAVLKGTAAFEVFKAIRILYNLHCLLEIFFQQRE